MKIITNEQFDNPNGTEMGFVKEFFPDVHKDERGRFTQVISNKDIDLSWVVQINRSVSKAGVVRGLHAQKGRFCQGKLVEAVSGQVIDMIVDARPNSDTFGKIGYFKLESEIENKLWVPRGFLHGFIALPDSPAIFQYLVDNDYDKESEISINPQVVVKGADLSEFPSFEILLSQKDLMGADLMDFMVHIKQKYEKDNELWYN